MLLIVVLIYCVSRYCEILLPENAKAIALVALLLTILYCVGALALPAMRT